MHDCEGRAAVGAMPRRYSSGYLADVGADDWETERAAGGADVVGFVVAVAGIVGVETQY